MAKVEPAVLIAFGEAVRDARLEKGMTHPDVDEAMQGGIDKSHLSGIENGRRKRLSPVTVSRLIAALDMDKRWLECFKSDAAAPLAPPSKQPAEDAAQRDQTAERLKAKAQSDATTPPVAEALLTTLAYEFAGGAYLDLHTAYTALRQALQAAENIRNRGEMPPDNTGSQLNAVMAEVAKLNDQGATEDADALLDAEEARMRETQKAECDRMEQQAQAMLTQRIDQDRLRNRPGLAAERITRNLREFPQGKLFFAVNAKAMEWREDGDKAGDVFALQVALALAQGNYERVKTKKPLAASALKTLGWCHYRLAERLSGDRHLIAARDALDAAVKKTSFTKEPQNGAARLGNYASSLALLGERRKDTAILKQAVAAQRASLKVDLRTRSRNFEAGWNNLGNALQKLGKLTEEADTLRQAEEAFSEALPHKNKEDDPLDWGGIRSNLALVQRWLGTVTGDADKLQAARDGYAACEDLAFEGDAPFKWAILQWNIADLALARYHLSHDPALLAEARVHVGRARAFFVEGSDHQTERCDELIAQIAASEAGS